MKEFKIGKIAALLAVVCLLLLGVGCKSPDKGPLSDTQFLLNTVVTISLYDKQDEVVLKGAFDLCRRYENLLSKTVENSDVYRINHSEGKPVEIDLDTARLLEEGIGYRGVSQGMFDITAGSLTSLWDFTSGEKNVPSPEKIAQSLTCVGKGEIVIKKNADKAVVTVADRVEIDLGGIAKGYIGDQITRFLKEQGVGSAIVNLGGNLSLIGKRMDKNPFAIGIRDPLGEAGDYIASVKGEDISIVSSGSYERSFEKDGVFYHHILNPFTGYPVESDLAGVTIICKEGTRADAMSTICFLEGEEKGRALAEIEEGLEAIFVTKDGKVTYTTGLQENIQLESGGDAK